MYLLWPPTQHPTASEPDSLGDEALLTLYSPIDPDRPCLRLNFVTSLDGADSLDGYSEGLSGPADKRVFGVLRTWCDALLVGAGTLRHEGYAQLDLGERRRALRVRLGLAEHPPLVILSRRLALDPDHPMFTAAPVRPIVLTCAASAAERRAALGAVADVIVEGDATVDLRAGMAALHRRGLRQILCEGGPTVLGTLTAADLVDEFCLTVSPLLTGGAPGRLSAGPPIDAPRRLTLRHAITADGMLLLRYARRERVDP